jgi:hypothetical protein
MDSQSAKTTSVGGIRGYDGGKNLSGRKRHLVACTPWVTLGLVLKAKVHTADIQDRAAVPQVLEGVKETFCRLAHVWLDQGYTGSGKAWIEQHLGWSVEIVQHAPSERGEWRYTRNQEGKLEGKYMRFAPEPKKGFKGCSQGDGSSSEHCPGSARVDGYRRITSAYPRPVRRSSTLR